jgi:hypothetical protein
MRSTSSSSRHWLLKAALKTDEGVSAALLTSAISFLKLTGTDSPEAPKRSDRLAASLPSSADLAKLVGTGGRRLPTQREHADGLGPLV